MAGALFGLPLLALILGAALIVPSVVLPFGVRVPPERVGAPVVAAEHRQYRLLVLVGGGGIAVAAVLIAALTDLLTVTPVAAFAIHGLTLLAYGRAHVAIAAAKQREGWYADLTQAVVVDTSLRSEPERFPWAWAIPSLLLLAATVAIGVVRYPQLPAVIPIHYGLNGVANGFAPKSIASAFGSVFAQAGITVIVIGTAWLSRGTRADLDPRQPGASARQHRAWVGGMTRAMLALAACANVTFLVISLHQWQHDLLGAWALVLALLPVLVGVAALLAVALRTVRDGPAPATAIAGGPVTRDDDRFWIGGLLYWNRDDPAVLVPRRFGVGLTLNLANVRAWLVIAALVSGVVDTDMVHLTGVDHVLKEDGSGTAAAYGTPLPFSSQLERAVRAFAPR